MNFLSNKFSKGSKKTLVLDIDETMIFMVDLFVVLEIGKQCLYYDRTLKVWQVAKVTAQTWCYDLIDSSGKITNHEMDKSHTSMKVPSNGQKIVSKTTGENLQVKNRKFYTVTLYLSRSRCEKTLYIDDSLGEYIKFSYETVAPAFITHNRYAILARPHLERFLYKAWKRFDLIVFTAGLNQFHTPTLEGIRKIVWRWCIRNNKSVPTSMEDFQLFKRAYFRHSAKPYDPNRDGWKDVYVRDPNRRYRIKRLDVCRDAESPTIENDTFDDCLIVDNEPISFRGFELNAYWIPDFNGLENDNEIKKVLEFLLTWYNGKKKPVQEFVKKLWEANHGIERNPSLTRACQNEYCGGLQSPSNTSTDANDTTSPSSETTSPYTPSDEIPVDNFDRSASTQQTAVLA